MGTSRPQLQAFLLRRHRPHSGCSLHQQGQASIIIAHRDPSQAELAMQMTASYTYCFEMLPTSFNLAILLRVHIWVEAPHSVTPFHHLFSLKEASNQGTLWVCKSMQLEP